MSEPEKSPQERLAALESAVRFIADTMSRQAGELQALQAGLHGFLRVAGPDHRIRDAIENQLERCIAMNLGQSTNQPLVDTFTEAANLIRLAMDEHKELPPG